MTPEELEAKLNELSHIAEIQTELLVFMANQIIKNNAEIEAALAGQREILFKMGVSKEETAKRQANANNAAVVGLSEQLKQLLARIGQSRDAGDELPPSRN